MTPPFPILEKLAGVSALAALALHLCFPHSQQNAPPNSRVIEILADHDSRYKMAGLREPEITVKAGEQITLRITAVKAKQMNRDGAIHGFALLHAKDKKPVPGWDFTLRPGTQDINVTAPEQPGDYMVVCTVICSHDHEGMRMKFVVTP